ncbi:MAG: hypothetical protein K0R19_1235 [Bacillota bacterium]|jgi:hypothetical protein|nr:hypothetical protein [Bacillota bacterium]
MKSEKLLDEIGLIDDRLIAEAETYEAKRKKKKGRWLGLAAVAACAAIIFSLGLIPKEPDPSLGLPKLTINENMGDYGFEGFLAYDVKELSDGNPWNENDRIDTLPVFRNPVSYDAAGLPINGLSEEQMMQTAKDTAETMELAIDSVSLSASGDEAVAICGDVTINAEPDGGIRIIFGSSVQLPEEYRFTFHDTTQKEAQDVLQYLLSEYQAVSGLKSPSLSLFGDYNINGQRTFSYDAFESEGDFIQRILGYNFNRISFSPDDEGKLWIIDRYKANLSQKIGDYPIITAQKARELLLQKKYITSVPEKMPGEKMIAGVELIYRTSHYDEIFMPYYRFLVELPSMKMENGLKTFGAFYVPAVGEAYLTNMPRWNGNFN